MPPLLADVLRVLVVGALLAIPTSPTFAQQAPAPAAPPTPADAPPRLLSLDAAFPQRDALRAALERQEYAEAERILVAAHEADPQSAQVLILLGGLFFLESKPLNAAIAYKKAEAIVPLDDRSRFTLAMAYVALGQGQWARPELERLTAARPEQAPYLYWLARLDYDAMRYDAALVRLRAVVARDPAFTRAWDSMGLCYEALGDDVEAERHFDRAVRLNREAPRPSAWPPLNYGLLLKRANRIREADALLSEAVRHDARLPQARYELGVLLEAMGKPNEAVESLRRAGALDPAYPEPHYALARLLRRLGRAHDADRELETFQTLRRQKQAAASTPDVRPR